MIPLLGARWRPSRGIRRLISPHPRDWKRCAMHQRGPGRRALVRSWRLWAAVVLAVAGAATAMLAFAAPAGAGVTGAISSTDDPGWVYGTGDAGAPYTAQACINGLGVNCNIYLDKRDVFLSGLPVSASLGAGTYFFAVLDPGGQANPNDAGANNLSDTNCLPYTCPATNGDGSPIPSGDAWTNREFTVDGSGNITYSGPHEFDQTNNKIGVFPFDDTQNNGGEYILAVCQVPGSPTTGDGAPGVDPKSCKYDAFKVRKAGECTSDCGGGGNFTDLSVFKTATPQHSVTYQWDAAKNVDKTSVDTSAGSSV